MSRETQNVLLLLLGLGAGVIVAKGTYLHFVKPGLGPWLMAAAIGLIVLAVLAIVRDVRNGAASADGHQHRTWTGWLLLLPVALMVFVAVPPLGAGGATPELTGNAAPHLRPFPPLPPGPAPTVALPEVLMRAATDSTSSLDGRTITVTGFTLASAAAAPDLGRVVIVCCAADAQLARIHLTGAIGAYPADTWLQVQGRVLPGTSSPATGFIPTMDVMAVTRIDKPANTYAY
jgi:putative membrane protein